ncbi:MULTISPECIES: hypothetical protein, partial [unclassified Streptomyces]|uniref:hypothetical protein n=1 Tax=unclassified Streptomyces TaxID=2593676 RepID=UPI001C408B46
LPLAADHQPATRPDQPPLHQLLHHAHSPHVEEAGPPLKAVIRANPRTAQPRSAGAPVLLLNLIE